MVEQAKRIGADIQELAVRQTNERFVAALRAKGIDHDYKVLEHKTHDWNVWAPALAEDLPGMMAVLNH